MTITLAEGKSSTPISGARVRIEGDMSHPGMQPIFGNAVESAPGKYEAPLTFTMPGDWYLEVRATLSDGRTVKSQVPVPGVGAMQ